MSSLIEKLKLKPQPEVKKQFTIGVIKETKAKPDKDEDAEPEQLGIQEVKVEGDAVGDGKDDGDAVDGDVVEGKEEVGIKLIDKRKEGYNRSDLMKR